MPDPCRCIGEGFTGCAAHFAVRGCGRGLLLDRRPTGGHRRTSACRVTSRAIGAAAVDPPPPCSTTTATAYLGDCHVGQSSQRARGRAVPMAGPRLRVTPRARSAAVMLRTWAVPVLPAMRHPVFDDATAIGRAARRSLTTSNMAPAAFCAGCFRSGPCLRRCPDGSSTPSTDLIRRGRTSHCQWPAAPSSRQAARARPT